MFELLDIESLFGPHWDKQVTDICNVLGNDTDECKLFKDVPVGPIAGGIVEGYSEIGVQQLLHLA